MTHLLHDEKKSMTEPYFENLLKDVTRTKTMGAPRAPPAPKAPLPHKVSTGSACAAGNLAASEAQLRRKARGGGGGGTALFEVENFRSKLPMKWAVGSGPMSSAYMVRLKESAFPCRLRCLRTLPVIPAAKPTLPCASTDPDLLAAPSSATSRKRISVQDTIGRSAIEAGHAAKSRVSGFKPIVITCPYGACDPVTDVSRFERIMVPEAYVQASAMPFTDEDRNPPETTNRMTFQKRSAAEMAASLLAAEEQMKESQKMKVRHRDVLRSIAYHHATMYATCLPPSAGRTRLTACACES